MIFFVLLSTIVFAGLGYFAHTGYERRKLLSRSWGEVLGNVKPMDLSGLEIIANHVRYPDQDQSDLTPARMWEIVGGLEGLNRLKTNAWAMRNLAVYAERWNCAQAPLVSEMIRADAERIDRAVNRIQLGILFHFGFLQSSDYLQEAAAAYALIRSRLVALYEVSNVGSIPCLEGML